MLIIDNTVRESQLCILLKDNRPTPGVIVDRNLVYVQNFTPGRTYILFLDSNGNPDGHLSHKRTGVYMNGYIYIYMKTYR